MIDAVIFDLDGVIVNTDHYHFHAWKKIADEEFIYFDEKINQQLRGVSRSNSLEIILKNTEKAYSTEEKTHLCEKKNTYYKQMIEMLNPTSIIEHVTSILLYLKQLEIKTAVASSSKNAKYILKRLNLIDFFDAIVDGNDIQYSKPDPEIFLKAKDLLGVSVERCLVIEDAISGIEAAISAGMKVINVGDTYLDYEQKSVLSILDFLEK